MEAPSKFAGLAAAGSGFIRMNLSLYWVAKSIASDYFTRTMYLSMVLANSESAHLVLMVS